MDTESIGCSTLFVRENGPQDVPAIVYANSLGTDLRVWAPMLPHMPGGWRHIRYDKRGHGLTETTAERWQIDDLVDDLAGLIEARRAGPAVVVGLSVGGLIAMGLAGRRPDLVRGLVLADTGAKIGTADMWNGRIEAIAKDGMAAVVDATMERWFTPDFRKDRGRIAPWRMMLRRSDAEGYITTSAAIRDADYRDLAAGLNLPAMAVVGESDGATPPEMVRQTARMIRGCRFDVIAGAGHIPPVEQPQVLAGLIGGFLDRLP
ncbi:MAG: 3-oxoadipate enol-lactonase [Pseudomonadota bacterium]